MAPVPKKDHDKEALELYAADELTMRYFLESGRRRKGFSLMGVTFRYWDSSPERDGAGMAGKIPERRKTLTPPRHLYGQLEGVDGAGRIGLSGARQVEGGSVVRAQPGTGKAQRDIHGGMEVHQF